jgi:hypothetical protein
MNKPLPLQGLIYMFEKDFFSLSYAKFFVEFRRHMQYVISFLRNSAVHQRDSTRNEKAAF